MVHVAQNGCREVGHAPGKGCLSDLTCSIQSKALQHPLWHSVIVLEPGMSQLRMAAHASGLTHLAECAARNVSEAVHD